MPDEPSLPDWPAPRFVEREDGYRSAWFARGPQDGVPLVLCHGLAASGLQFAADAEFFAGQGYRVIVPDLRGHGRSTCPDERTDDDFDIPVMADDLLAILDTEGLEGVHWVGNSLGGIVALDMLGRVPERIRSLVTFGTAYALDLPTGLVTLGAAGYQLLGAEITALFGAPMTCRAPEAQAVIRAMLREADVDAVIRAGKAVHKYDLIGNALGYHGAILMIRGDLDRAVNSGLEPTLQAMNDRDNFRLVDLADAGHCANLDQPDEMRRLIRETSSA